MHGQGFFLQAFVYLAAAVIAVPIAKRLGLGSVLGYLLAGVAIGPFGLRLIGAEGQDVMHFAEFGVVMMLFLVGLELQPALLWRLRGPLFGMGGKQVAGTALAGAGIGMVAGLPWQTALAAGLVLAMSSTAIVLQSLGERGLMSSEGGQRAFAVLLFQDLAVIPMLALLPLLAAHGVPHAAAGHGGTWIDSLPGWGRAAAVLVAVAVVVAAGQLLARPVLRAVARTRLREMFTAASLLLVIGIALLMNLVGLSPALGTFLAGVVLANSEYRHELEGDLEPFKGLLLGVFFIAVGAGIDFGLIGRSPGAVAALVAGLIVVKAAVLLAVGRASGMKAAPATMLAFALAQGGEFCFVLLSFAAQNGVFDARLAGLLTAAVALSMAATPLVMLAEERLLRPRLGPRAAYDRAADAVDHRSPVLIAGYGNFGSTVGRLLQANGVQPVVLENDGDHVEFLRRLGLRVFYGDASRLDLLHAAGAAEARLIVLATGDTEKTLEIARVARKHFPQATVMARARGRWQAYSLLDAGVERVYRDTLDTSLRLGVDALRHLGFRAHQAVRSAQLYRRRDEASVTDLAGLHRDRGAYLSEARQRIRDLEEALLAEAERPHDEGHPAWDAESLREEFGRPRPQAPPASLLAALLLLSLAPAVVDAATPADTADDPRARRLMEAVERGQRAGSRFFSMEIGLSIAGRFTPDRLMFGLAGEGREATRILYVYLWPRLLRGSTLVVEDAVAPEAGDHVWIGLPGLSTFREVEAASLQLLVPGTGLTYEDARGWIEPDPFTFRFRGDVREGRTIIARPRNDSLARILGTARIEIRLDPARAVVTSAHFYDGDDRFVKSYEATEFVPIGGRWYPARVRTTHRTQQIEADFVYRYRALRTPPPRGLFRLDPGDRPFLDRLLEWRDARGLTVEFPDTLTPPAVAPGPGRRKGRP